jgi:hypothetical protein
MTDAPEKLYIRDPLVELLAIKLYEHDHRVWPTTCPAWIAIHEEDRQLYRNMAAGKTSFPGPIKDE